MIPMETSSKYTLRVGDANNGFLSESDTLNGAAVAKANEAQSIQMNSKEW
jgi:hypothetical protein